MKMTSTGIYLQKDGVVSAHHSGFGVNGGPLKDRLQTTKMCHSLVTCYLHASHLTDPFTNIKGIRLHFAVYSQYCCSKSILLLGLNLMAPWICCLNCSYKQSLSVSVKTSQAEVYQLKTRFCQLPSLAEGRTCI